MGSRKFTFRWVVHTSSPVQPATASTNQLVHTTLAPLVPACSYSMLQDLVLIDVSLFLSNCTTHSVPVWVAQSWRLNVNKRGVRIQSCMHVAVSHIHVSGMCTVPLHSRWISADCALRACWLRGMRMPPGIPAAAAIALAPPPAHRIMYQPRQRPAAHL